MRDYILFRGTEYLMTPDEISAAQSAFKAGKVYKQGGLTAFDEKSLNVMREVLGGTLVAEASNADTNRMIDAQKQAKDAKMDKRAADLNCKLKAALADRDIVFDYSSKFAKENSDLRDRLDAANDQIDSLKQQLSALSGVAPVDETAVVESVSTDPATDPATQ
jgi:hypothetical protein